MITCLKNGLLAGVMVAAVGLPLTAVAATDNGTLTVGSRSAGICNAAPVSNYGYYVGTLGSYSPTALTGGSAVSVAFDVVRFLCPSGSNSYLMVSGFTSSPGASWLTSITCNGIVNYGSTAGFSYSSGVATWGWTQLFGFISKNGASVSCSIVHN